MRNAPDIIILDGGINHVSRDLHTGVVTQETAQFKMIDRIPIITERTETKWREEE